MEKKCAVLLYFVIGYIMIDQHESHGKELEDAEIVNNCSEEKQMKKASISNKIYETFGEECLRLFCLMTYSATQGILFRSVMLKLWNAK